MLDRRWFAVILPSVALVVLVGLATKARADEPVTRTFAAPQDRIWLVTQSVLKSLDWSIDAQDQAIGSIVTDSRSVAFREFGVYGEGTRHRLRLAVQSAGEGRTTVSVLRELYKEERILWIKDRKPLKATDNKAELAVLDAIARALPAGAAGPAPAVSPAPPPSSPPPASTAPSGSQAARPRPEGPVKVTYRLTGTAQDVSVTYRDARGETDRKEVRLPWEVSFDAKAGESLYVSAVSASGEATGSVSCEIVVAGAAWSQSTSVGASAIATCSAAAERR